MTVIDVVRRGEHNRSQIVIHTGVVRVIVSLELSCLQLLALRALLHRRPDRLLDILGQRFESFLELPLSVRRFDFGDGALQWGDCSQAFLLPLDPFLGFLLWRQQVIESHVSKEHSDRTVVVHAGDRIKLVVVAAGAVDRQAHEALERRPDHVVQIVVAIVRVGLLAESHSRPEPVKGGSSETIVGRLVKLVAGNLLDEELVVGLVLVQRLDHIVPIPPSCIQGAVMLETRALREADHIEPEPSPALAVVAGCQQPLD